jgi:nicotinate-nucleotide pyrophosphorylase (carboxylating)
MIMKPLPFVFRFRVTSCEFVDNMDPEELRLAVAVARDGTGGGPLLEASGGITLENVADYAATGVDFVSVGALTHSAPALDLSMDLDRPAQG